MLQEYKYIGCMLLFLTIHFSWIKGGSLFKRMLIRYLEDTSNKMHNKDLEFIRTTKGEGAGYARNIGLDKVL